MSSSIENATIQPEGVNTELLCTIFSWLGTAFALFLNLTPAVLFIDVFKNNKSHKTIPELMLIFNVLCGLFWFCYWFRMDNPVPCYSSLGNLFFPIFVPCCWKRFNEMLFRLFHYCRYMRSNFLCFWFLDTKH